MFPHRESFKFYRGDIDDDQKEEFESIMELAHNNDVPSKVNILGQLHFLTSSAFLRPFRCVGIIYMLSQLSGLLIINVYTLTYLEG